MKSKLLLFFAVIVSATLISCSEDEEKMKGDPDITHEGAKWNITAINYVLIDQSTTGQVMRTGSQGTGSFYFVDGQTQGSFEMIMEGYNKEDFFTYTIDGASITVVTIDQSVGKTTNQNVVALSGSVISDTERSLSGSIIKQSMTGQFTLNFDVSLVKD